MTITPGNYDITIYQGSSFNQVFTWRDQNNTLINLTAFTARMMARLTVDSASPFITLTTENGGIALGGALGTITLNMTAAQTTLQSPAMGVYDLEVVDGAGLVSRLLQGNIYVSAEVTR